MDTMVEDRGDAGPAPVDHTNSVKVPLLRIEDLVVAFEKPVVRGLSFVLGAGQVLALVGESGSGKTMTCLAILGLLPGSAKVSGSVALSGRELMGLSEDELARHRQREAALIFQEPRAYLDPSMKVGSQIEELLILKLGLSGSAARRRRRELLESVGLPGERPAASFPHELSGGMCQRASIALAISCDPVLLLADEPTTALDASVQRSILDLLLEIVASRSMGLVFVTHDLRAVDYVADRVAVMLEGLIVEEGPREEILSRPLHPYTRLLLDSLPGEGFLARKRPGTEVAAAKDGCPFAGRCAIAIPDCSTSLPVLGEVGPGRGVRCIRAEVTR
jgi:oligopeptide/dipeptide ABC transporter ATP-binding protein